MNKSFCKVSEQMRTGQKGPAERAPDCGTIAVFLEELLLDPRIS